jgi:FKBP-type peptidyl-prolyl cis-trans isomerase FkpA
MQPAVDRWIRFIRIECVKRRPLYLYFQLHSIIRKQRLPFTPFRKGNNIMKRLIVAAMIVPLMLGGCNTKSPFSADVKLKTHADSLSYALGLDIGGSLKKINAVINLAVFSRGVSDVINDQKQMLTPEQSTQIKQAFFQKSSEEQMAKAKEEGAKNLKAGEDFLADNAKKSGIKTTASGLQYQVIKEGTGPQPKASDNVKVNYVGTLLSGKEFDSSIKRGQPAEFQLDRVIPGWTEGVQLMKVGGKSRFWVPAKLAYGERQAGPDIGPNSTLIFDIDLLSITPAVSAPAVKK